MEQTQYAKQQHQFYKTQSGEQALLGKSKQALIKQRVLGATKEEIKVSESRESVERRRKKQLSQLFQAQQMAQRR